MNISSELRKKSAERESLIVSLAEQNKVLAALKISHSLKSEPVKKAVARTHDIASQLSSVKAEIAVLHRQRVLDRDKANDEHWYWTVLRKAIKQRLADGEITLTQDESDAFDFMQDNANEVFQSKVPQPKKRARKNANSIDVINSFKGAVQ